MILKCSLKVLICLIEAKIVFIKSSSSSCKFIIVNRDCIFSPKFGSKSCQTKKDVCNLDCEMTLEEKKICLQNCTQIIINLLRPKNV